MRVKCLAQEHDTMLRLQPELLNPKMSREVVVVVVEEGGGVISCKNLEVLTKSVQHTYLKVIPLK